MNNFCFIFGIIITIFLILCIIVGFVENSDFFVYSIIFGAFAAFSFIITFTYTTNSNIQIKEEVVYIKAFENDSFTKIYGYINGGLLHTNGEITSEPGTFLTVLSIDESGKATFKNFDLTTTEIYFKDVDKPYYVEYCKTWQEDVILFGRKINKNTTERHRILKDKYIVVLPYDSIKYDNSIN